MRREARIEDRIAVIVGGGRGIGRATALTLARAGAAVIVVARTKAEIETVAECVREEGGRARAIAADVSDWAAVERLAEEVTRIFGPADIVVANAGVIDPVGDIWEVAPDAWARSLDVNLTGAFYVVRAFLPPMVARQKGVMIFTSSGAATHPVVGWSAYCAAKAGLDHFVRTVAAEVDQRNVPVRIHALRPGIVDTSMQERIRTFSEEQFAEVDKFRAYREKGWLRPPDEPAALIWWLSTPMAAEFHGQVVSIDDPVIRKSMAADLGVPIFKGRGNESSKS